MMNNWKDLYENEKRQRLHTETTMKEIVNGLCLSAFTISEDSKMQLLKNDLQRLQQEIARLENSKQQRLQQHLLSIGGMIQQMTGSGGPPQNVPNNMMNSVSNRTLSNAQSPYINNNQQPAFTNVQRLNGTSNAQRLSMSLQTGVNNVRTQQTVAKTENFQKPRPQSRAPRRKRNAVTVDESVRSNSAVPPLKTSVVNNISINRPLSTVPPISDSFKNSPNVASVQTSDLMSTDNTKPDSPERNNNKSQVEDEIVVTGAVHGNVLNGTEKSKFFCDFCETSSANEEETVAHLWKHVNEIKNMYAFECVVIDCNFKSNVIKDALTHKKSHASEENCKILDRRDSLNEYFKHCVNKYFVRLDDETKEKVFFINLE